MGIAAAATTRHHVERRSLYVEVTCATCGAKCELSERRERAIRAEGTTPICPECRLPRTPPDGLDYLFWIRRFSLDEIRLLAWAIFGRDT